MSASATQGGHNYVTVQKACSVLLSVLDKTTVDYSGAGPIGRGAKCGTIDSSWLKSGLSGATTAVQIPIRRR